MARAERLIDMRTKKKAIIASIFFLLGVFSRAIFSSKAFTHLDAVLYAIGTFDYSLKNGTPPSPGYFLYIMSGKFLNLIFGDPHISLSLISIFYSGLIAAMLYYFGYCLRGNLSGCISAILFLTSPVMWFKGVTIWGYLNSGFFILLTAFFCYKAITERNKIALFFSSISFAILVGIRPQEFLVISILYMFTLLPIHTKFRDAVYAVAIFFVVCLIWFIPFLSMVGGWSALFDALRGGSTYLIDDSILGGNIFSKMNNHLIRMTQFFERSYFLGVIPLVYYVGRFFYLPSIIDNKKVQFFIFWLFPSIFYNIFIQFGEIGHGMSWGLGLFLILGESVAVFCEDILQMLSKLSKVGVRGLSWFLQGPYRRGLIYTFVLSPIILTNFLMFFYDFKKDLIDFYTFEGHRHFNYQMEVVKNNKFLISKVDFIKKNFKRESTLIISSTVFGHQVMYYLPEAWVIEANIFKRKDSFSFTFFNHFKSSDYNKKDFVIPMGINKLILFDEIFMPYFQNDKQKVAYFEVGTSYKLLVCDVHPGQRVIFDYRSIRIE